MDIEIIPLAERLRSELIFLFLGQNYFPAQNPLIKLMAEKYGVGSGKSHNVFFRLKDKTELEQVKKQVELIPTSDETETICMLPWNGVITSSVDGLAERCLRCNWREVQALYRGQSLAAHNLADRNRLCISYLFGSLNNAAEQIPLNNRALINAKENATIILNKYDGDVLTPRGIVIFEGYDPKDDWLDMERLNPFLARCFKGQVHHFGKSINDPLWREYVEDGIIIEHEQRFYDYLQEEIEAGNIDLQQLIMERGNDNRIQVNFKSFAIPTEIYNRTSQSAMILDDRILIKVDRELDEETAREEFSNFLYESSFRPVWDGYKYGMYFKRSMESVIFKDIREKLEKDFNVEPIIIEGQSGSGKSVLLGKTAFEYKIKREYPVLFISKEIQHVDFEDIRIFCDWLDDVTDAKRVLIFWDSSAYKSEIQKYLDLNNFLTSHGKKVLVIGTALSLGQSDYKIGKNKYPFRRIEIKPILETDEKKSFCDMLNKYSGKKITDETIKSYGDNILTACYMLLPSSRRGLRKGLVEEANKNIIALKDLLRPVPQNEDNPFYREFLEKLSEMNVSAPEKQFEEIMGTEKLIAYICLAAQFNISTPFNLILRCFDWDYALEVSGKINEIDFFRFEELRNGNLQVTARSAIEAKIVVKWLLEDFKEMLKDTLKLISEVTAKFDDFNLNQNYESMGSEVNFMVELIKAIGPNSDVHSFEKSYEEIAGALSKKRLEGIKNTSTIIQESMLYREAAKKIFVENENDWLKKHELAAKSQKLIEEEITHLQKNDGRNNHNLGLLYGELAANLAMQIKDMTHSGKMNLENFKQSYENLIKALLYTRNLLPESFHGLDIAAWSCINVFSRVDIPDYEKMEIFTDTMAMFDSALDAYPQMSALEDYQRRLHEVADLSGNKEVAENAFEKLLEMGSGAGIYFNVKKKLKSTPLNARLDNEKIPLIQEILEYMGNYTQIICQDERCLRLMLRLKWLLYTKWPLMGSEKQELSLNKEQWTEIVEIIDRILSFTPEQLNAVLKYIRAIGLFFLKDKNYKQAFKELRNVYFPFDKRIIMNYTSNEEYRGKIIRLSDENRSKTVFQIEGIIEPVPYFDRKFASEKHELHDFFEHLEIGFNFMGIQISRTVKNRRQKNV